MTIKSLSERITEGFTDEATRAYAVSYTETLQQNIRDFQSNFNRSLVLIFFSIAAFVLLSQAAVKEVSLGALKLKDYSLLYIALPGIIAYLSHEMVAIAAARNLYESIHNRIIREVHNTLYQNDLELLLTFPTPNYIPDLIQRYLTYTLTPSRTKRVLNSALTISNKPTGLVVVFGPMVFAAYAFYKLFTVFDYTHIGVWLSLAVTIYFLGMGYAILVAQWQIIST